MDAPTYVPLGEPFLIVTQIVEAGVERIFPSAVTATWVGATVRLAAGGPTGPLLPPPQAASVTTVATQARRTPQMPDERRMGKLPVCEGLALLPIFVLDMGTV